MKGKKGLILIAIIILFMGVMIGGMMVVKNQQIKTKVHQLYTQWQNRYVMAVEEGDYINASEIEGQNFAVSESQGYGMLIILAAEKYDWAEQKDFDALTNYYLNHRISEDNQLMAWKQTKREGQMVTEPTQNVSATDGDLDIAYALLKADERWGSTGRYDYASLANQLLKSLLTYTYQKDTQVLTIGDWATDSDSHRKLVRTSDLIPAYYRYFYQRTQEPKWHLIADQAQKILQTLSDQTTTGLFPDFAVVDQTIKPASSNALEGENDGNYAWNATRVPWRLALSKENQDQQINAKLLHFFASQPKIVAGYTLSGGPLTENTSPAFFAPIAIAANQQPKNFPKLAETSRTKVLEMGLSGTYYADTLQVIAGFYLLELEGNLWNRFSILT